MAGIMHFSNFFRFMEAAEQRLLPLAGLFGGAGPATGWRCACRASMPNATMLAPLRFEDEVLVRLLVERKGRRSLTYQFRFCRLNGSGPQEVARGRLTVVCVEAPGRRIPESRAVARGHRG